MQLTVIQSVIIFVSVALGTLLTRLLPFLIFREGKRPPEFVRYLGKMLPPAMMALLVVYCLRNVNVFSFPNGLPELISIVVIVILHKWKSNVLLSIASGTVSYMLLVQFVFI